ncbi:MAG: putative AlkP superfamily pyrophosphatase or phosphodiesterase [Rhodothermales bacterium]|jgi:predicted AlkP superfamily pyrophosphatase or phosphodiesterase
MRYILVLVSFALAACSPGTPQGSDEGRAPTLILISIDGFRADFMDLYDVPNLSALAEGGVYANEGMLPVFPTKTFPNHYSIATGMYPASTGMVANTMFDERRNEWFRISDREAVEDPFWWGGEPIWVTAELQGQTSATFFWVGSEGPVKGIQPRYWFRHDESVPGTERVDQVLAWLDLPADDRPTVITLYFSDVDSQAHYHGPESAGARNAVEKTDALMGRLLQGLKDRRLEDSVNLMVVSDHGMTTVDPDSTVFLEDYFDPEDGMVVEYSPVLAIRPQRGREASVRAQLSQMPGVDLLGASDLEAFNYSGHYRIPAVIALAHEGWTIYSTREFPARSGPPNPGNHGYHPDSEGMRALFVAYGPAFERGVRVEPFENIHLYNLMARVVGLAPAPNDGDFAVVESFLR